MTHPGQRRVIDRLLADTRYAAVVSAPQLAHEVGVSESTVTRAAQTLGFAGYPDLQARLRQRFVDGVPEHVEASLVDLGDTPEAAAIRVMLEDAESVRATAEDLDPATLSDIVDLLVGARRVYVFGARGSFGLALILAIGLRLLLPDARLLNRDRWRSARPARGHVVRGCARGDQFSARRSRDGRRAEAGGPTSEPSPSGSVTICPARSRAPRAACW